MPCDRSYLATTEEQKNSREIAGHILYVLESLGQPIPVRYIEVAGKYYGDKDMLDELVFKLHQLCRGMGAEEQDRIMYDGRNSNSRSLADWWEKHIADGKEKPGKEAIVRKALSKLTPEEREALDIK